MAGTVFGVMNFWGNFAGVLAPIAIGSFTPTGSLDEWRKVFFLTAGMQGVGWLAFIFLVPADEEEWAKRGPEEKCHDTSCLIGKSP